jgi:beta-glucosidase
MSHPRLLLSALAAVLALQIPAAADEGPVPDSPAIERRVDAMISRMTLAEKIDLIGGDDSMFIRAVPSAGFPKLKMSDGPVAVRTWGPTTAYAGGIALAAAWDPGLARRMGESMGEDARARGVNFLLGPGLNIYRAPMNGRNFEYFGEDPYLAARTAVAYVEGLQSKGVSATIKHYAANNSEYDRHNLSSDIDERTLREIYLPAFEAAVREAGAGAVMNSYNRLNGVHATQNAFLNLRVLKGDWGFQGLLMSDWSATYDAVGAANNGLDLEMPRADFMNRARLLPAIAAGKVSEATIDDKVRRIFRTAIRFGFLDRDQADPGLPLYSERGRQVALDEALESVVLLKNLGGLLPLDPDRIRTIAVLGPDAWPPVSGGGGSSTATPFRATSVLTGVSDFLGSRVRVLYARGLPSPDELFRQTVFDDDAGQPGLKEEIFDNPDFQGAPTTVWHVRSAVGWRPEMWTPRAAKPQSVRWTGRYTPRTDGLHLFLVGAGGEDRWTLYVDGREILRQPFAEEGQAPLFAEVPLEAGRTVTVRLDYLPYSDHIRAGFGIRSAADLVSPEARRIASMADAAIVCAGFDGTTESEGFDRTFTLPWGQDDLISAVAAANPRTIVALTAGGGVDMRRWLGRVPAVLHNWYPGQEGGTALAEILFGARSPEGKLPATFDRSWEDSPVHDSYYPPAGSDPSDPRVRYSEGVFLGYRAYTTQGREPLFAFGFGLSYTSFAFSDLSVPAASDTGDSVTVGFDVANVGDRPGAEVAQLYVGDPSARVPRPVKELKGYSKVRLQPGETARVTLTLDRRSFAYFDVQAHAWRIDPGRFVIFVGDASDHTPLSADLTISRGQTFGP